MHFAAYLDEIRSVYATGVASEHSYRPALLRLFQSIDPALDVINEPRRVEVGAPDFIFQRGKGRHRLVRTQGYRQGRLETGGLQQGAFPFNFTLFSI